MKKFKTLFLTIVVVLFSAFTLNGCTSSKEVTYEGVYEYTKGDYSIVMYVYDNNTCYVVEFDDGEIDYSYKYVYKVLEKNKYIALTDEDGDTDVFEYEVTGFGTNLDFNGMLFKKR